jgi:hypothetical protein
MCTLALGCAGDIAPYSYDGTPSTALYSLHNGCVSRLFGILYTKHAAGFAPGF